MPAPRPLAYFITFRTYGTWLHGDERGSTQRSLAGPDAPLLDPNPRREAWEAGQRLDAPVTLRAAERRAVDAAIRQTAEVRDWYIHALNVRTNHVHVVVSAEMAPELVMGSLKAWCTKLLGEAGLVATGAKVWSRHGSTRYLWREEQVVAACQYVVKGQGADR
ncbi:MAG: hypothetical protein ACKVT1_10340 [Dehalococcoidia bacterium]